MERKENSFFGVLFLGAIIGAIGGLFFAPTTGKELRKKVKDFIDENQEIIPNSKEKTENLIQKTKKAIEDGFDHLSKMIDDKKTEIKKEEEI